MCMRESKRIGFDCFLMFNQPDVLPSAANMGVQLAGIAFSQSVVVSFSNNSRERSHKDRFEIVNIGGILMKKLVCLGLLLLWVGSLNANLPNQSPSESVAPEPGYSTQTTIVITLPEFFGGLELDCKNLGSGCIGWRL